MTLNLMQIVLQIVMKILTERFIELTSNKHDCTWMEVDSLQEKVQLTEAKMQQKMSQVGKITTRQSIRSSSCILL